MDMQFLYGRVEIGGNHVATLLKRPVQVFYIWCREHFNVMRHPSSDDHLGV